MDIFSLGLAERVAGIHEQTSLFFSQPPWKGKSLQQSVPLTRNWLTKNSLKLATVSTTTPSNENSWDMGCSMPALINMCKCLCYSPKLVLSPKNNNWKIITTTEEVSPSRPESNNSASAKFKQSWFRGSSDQVSYINV